MDGNSIHVEFGDARVVATAKAVHAAAVVLAGRYPVEDHSWNCPVKTGGAARVDDCQCWVWRSSVDRAGLVLLAALPYVSIQESAREEGKPDTEPRGEIKR